MANPVNFELLRTEWQLDCAYTTSTWAVLRWNQIFNGDDTKPDIRGVYQSAEVKSDPRPSVCTVTRKGVKSPLF